MTWFDVYLFTRLDSINFFFAFISLATLIGGGFVMLIAAISWEGNNSQLGEKIVRQGWIWFISIFVIFGGISCLIPTTKEAAAIYLIPKLVNNEQVQAIPENALKLLNLKFQAWIEEMEPAREK
jgi:hypothetical protein